MSGWNLKLFPGNSFFMIYVFYSHFGLDFSHFTHTLFNTSLYTVPQVPLYRRMLGLNP
jgi:hypothetical protein